MFAGDGAGRRSASQVTAASSVAAAAAPSHQAGPVRHHARTPGGAARRVDGADGIRASSFASRSAGTGGGGSCLSRASSPSGHPGVGVPFRGAFGEPRLLPPLFHRVFMQSLP